MIKDASLGGEAVFKIFILILFADVSSFLELVDADINALMTNDWFT